MLLAEVNNLKYAYGRTRMPLVQLTDDTFAPLPDNSYTNYTALLNDMSNIAKYAKGLGPFKATLLGNYDTTNGTIKAGPVTSSGIVEKAHQANLQVSIGVRRCPCRQVQVVPSFKLRHAAAPSTQPCSQHAQARIQPCGSASTRTWRCMRQNGGLCVLWLRGLPGCLILATTCTPCNKPHANVSLLPTAVTFHAQPKSPLVDLLIWSRPRFQRQPGADIGFDPCFYCIPSQVHLYTLRNDVNLSPFTSIDAEYSYYFKDLKVDGGFTDFPGTLGPWTNANGPWTQGFWNGWIRRT